MKIVEIYFTLFEFFVLKRSTVLVTYFGEKAQKKQADQHKVILPKKVILVASLLLASKDTVNPLMPVGNYSYQLALMG